MGTVSVSVVSTGVTNNQRTVTADVTYSSSYATGGDTLAPTALGLRQVEEGHVVGGKLDVTRKGDSFVPNAHGTQAVLAGTPSAPLIKVFNGSTSEVANATNLSTLPAVRWEFRGH